MIIKKNVKLGDIEIGINIIIKIWKEFAIIEANCEKETPILVISLLKEFRRIPWFVWLKNEKFELKNFRKLSVWSSMSTKYCIFNIIYLIKVEDIATKSIRIPKIDMRKKRFTSVFLNNSE